MPRYTVVIGFATLTAGVIFAYAVSIDELHVPGLYYAPPGFADTGALDLNGSTAHHPELCVDVWSVGF